MYDVPFLALAVLGAPQAEAAAPVLIDGLANRQIKQKQVIAMSLGRLPRNRPRRSPR